MDRGAGVNAGDFRGATPLMRACHSGQADVVALLLERGADPTLRDSAAWSALTYSSNGYECVGSDHVAVIRLLLRDGRVPIDARDTTGRYWWVGR